MTLLYLVAAWAAGLFLASTGPETPSAYWIGLAAASLVVAYIIRYNRPWRLGFICLAMFAFGAGRYTWATRPHPDHHIARYADSGYVTLTGIIDQDADVRENHVNLRIRAESITLNGKPQATEGLVLVQAPRYGDYRYGDRVTVSGSLLTPPEFDDFSYRDYLARRGIHAMISNARHPGRARSRPTLVCADVRSQIARPRNH
jgi:competence protein ComEC